MSGSAGVGDAFCFLLLRPFEGEVGACNTVALTTVVASSRRRGSPICGHLQPPVVSYSR